MPRAYVSSKPDGVLSYTQSLSILLDPQIEPRHLEGIYDCWIAFKNVRVLQIPLFAIHFIEDPALSSDYFSHFQPMLHCLHLHTWLKNPMDPINFINFFSLLEEVLIEQISFSILLLPDTNEGDEALWILQPSIEVEAV